MRGRRYRTNVLTRRWDGDWAVVHKAFAWFCSSELPTSDDMMSALMAVSNGRALVGLIREQLLPDAVDDSQLKADLEDAIEV